jgi:hypothetical protein
VQDQDLSVVGAPFGDNRPQDISGVLGIINSYQDFHSSLPFANNQASVSKARGEYKRKSATLGKESQSRISF